MSALPWIMMALDKIGSGVNKASTIGATPSINGGSSSYTEDETEYPMLVPGEFAPIDDDLTNEYVTSDKRLKEYIRDSKKADTLKKQDLARFKRAEVAFKLYGGKNNPMSLKQIGQAQNDILDLAQRYDFPLDEIDFADLFPKDNGAMNTDEVDETLDGADVDVGGDPNATPGSIAANGFTIRGGGGQPPTPGAVNNTAPPINIPPTTVSKGAKFKAGGLGVLGGILSSLPDIGAVGDEARKGADRSILKKAGRALIGQSGLQYVQNMKEEQEQTMAERLGYLRQQGASGSAQAAVMGRLGAEGQMSQHDFWNMLKEFFGGDVSDERLKVRKLRSDEELSDEDWKDIIGTDKKSLARAILEEGPPFHVEELKLLMDNCDEPYEHYDTKDSHMWKDDVLKGYMKHIHNYYYNYKPEAKGVDPSIDTQEEHIGPMAQDIEKVNPAAVKERNGYKTVDTGRLALMDSGAIAELSRIVKQLSDEVQELKNE